MLRERKGPARNRMSSTLRYWHGPTTTRSSLTFLDYASNVALYPKFQEYFHIKQTSLLAVCGKNDPFFLPPGAEAFKRDNPKAEVHFYDTGHFALERTIRKLRVLFAIS